MLDAHNDSVVNEENHLLTHRERVIEFICESVRLGDYNLAKLFIHHKSNLISSLTNTPLNLLNDNQINERIRSGLMCSLFHREVDRLLYYSCINKQFLLCLSELQNEFRSYLQSFTEEQCTNPTPDLIAAINHHHNQLIVGRRLKIINTIKDTYHARIEKGNSAYAWLGNACYTIEKNTDVFKVKFDHFVLLPLECLAQEAHTPTEIRIVKELIRLQSKREQLLNDLLKRNVINTQTLEYTDFYRLLLEIEEYRHTLLNEAQKNYNMGLLKYCKPCDVTIQSHDIFLVNKFYDLVQEHFPDYDTNKSFNDNVKKYTDLLNCVEHKHDEILDNTTTLAMKKECFKENISKILCSTYLFSLSPRELERLKKFFNVNLINDGVLFHFSTQLLQANEVIDIRGNNLLHVALESNFDQPFIQFLLDHSVNIFAQNTVKRRPIDMLAECCGGIPKPLYSLLLNHANNEVKKLCINDTRATRLNASEVAIEKMFNAISDYMVKEHFNNVRKLTRNRNTIVNKTPGRASNIMACLSFFYDRLRDDQSLDYVQLREFIEDLLKKIDRVVFSPRNGNFYNCILSVLKVLQSGWPQQFDRLRQQYDVLLEKFDKLQEELTACVKAQAEMSERQYDIQQQTLSQMHKMRDEMRIFMQHFMQTTNAQQPTADNESPQDRNNLSGQTVIPPYSPRFSYQEGNPKDKSGFDHDKTKEQGPKK